MLQYLKTKYSEGEVDYVTQLYKIGTSKKLGTVFWLINKQGKVQKAKVCYYNQNGKRTNRFEVPYKNSDGYYSCLFGEHLLKNNKKPIILVESEKTAIVSSIEFPEYTWLAYCGINGLTKIKLELLRNENITIIPDVSNGAVQIIKNKSEIFKTLNIGATIYDMTFGNCDEDLKKIGMYNSDIEDIFRNITLK